MTACFTEVAGHLKSPAKVEAVAVGCSGGPDSMALTCLLRDWAISKSISLTALVVDHGLRPEAGAEAARVAGWLGERGVTAVVLTRDGNKPTRNIQAEARRIRYALMRDWCVSHQVPVLAVAHHLEDQAETFLLRLARGSGVDGLAAMAPVAAMPGDPYGHVSLIRPLLDTSRDDLHGVLTQAGWPFVEDPSNHDIRHARVRMRNLAGALAREGLDPKRLARTARTMRRARQALDAATWDFLAASAFNDPYGYVGVNLAAFARLEDELALRALTRVLQLVAGGDYPVRLDRLENLAAALRFGTRRSGEPLGPRTLAGCRVETRGENVLIFREAAAIGPPVPALNAFVWDHRFRLELFGDLGALTLGKLGGDGVRQARELGLADARFEQAPGPARAALPALWCGPKLVAIPGMKGGAAPAGSAAVTAGFAQAAFEGSAVWNGFSSTTR